MSMEKKSFIKVAALTLGMTLVMTACNFGHSSVTESSVSSSSEANTTSTTQVTSSESSISAPTSTSSSSSSSVSSVSSTSTSSSIIPTLQSISLNTDNVKKEYNYGDTLTLAGLVDS